MFKHLFKLIWNKKKQNFLLLSEMLISFLVMFAVFTLLVYYYRNYKKPMGIDYENVWVVTFSNPLKTDNADSANLFFETLRQNIQSLPLVNNVSFCSSNVPFSSNNWQSSVTYNKNKFSRVDWLLAEDDYKKTLNIKLIEGRWFGKEDAVSKDKHIVINRSLKEKIFGNTSAVGQKIGDGDGNNQMQIIGVTEDVKREGDYATAGSAVYNRIDTGNLRWQNNMLVSVKPTADAAFEGKLYKAFANSMKNSNVQIEHLSDKRHNINYKSLVPMIILSIVAGFLVINVALGLFGVLWYNINKRRGEIGLRRAVGASGQSVSAQLVTESMILATLSIITGSFFAVQFPLLNVFDLSSATYFIALGLSIVFIYLLVLICSLYPGKQAAKVYPAVALHEE